MHDSVLVPEGDTNFAMRLARYCARNPVALDTRESRRVSYRSDKTEGPTAATEKLDPLEFLAARVSRELAMVCLACHPWLDRPTDNIFPFRAINRVRARWRIGNGVPTADSRIRVFYES